MVKIIVVIVAVILWRLYHKVFSVTYFDLGMGLLREIVTCLVIAYFIVVIIANMLGIQTTDMSLWVLSNLMLPTPNGM